MDSRFLLQGIFPTQGSNLGLLHRRQILYPLSHQGSHSPTSRCLLRSFGLPIIKSPLTLAETTLVSLDAGIRTRVIRAFRGCLEWQQTRQGGGLRWRVLLHQSFRTCWATQQATGQSLLAVKCLHCAAHAFAPTPRVAEDSSSLG